MPTLLEYRRRIRSVKSTQQLTRAMKFVAAAKLRRAQEGVFAARPYAREIVRVMHSAAGRIEAPVHPLLERRPEERVLAMVLTGDRTLCGAFNSNVVKRAVEFSRQHAGKKLSWIVVGKKGRDQLRKRGFPLLAEYVGISDRVDFRKAKEIAGRVAEIYAKQDADAVYVIYNEFKNVLVQKLRVEKLLPIDPEIFTQETTKGEQAHRADAERAGQVDYIYEQPPEQVFGGLLTRYLEAEVLRVLLESVAAEQAARMTAMEAATSNAGELIETLTLDMNKIRQAAITKELIEIVSGAASIA
jgi:F-type H+-transporting ATPase subunit gamma